MKVTLSVIVLLACVAVSLAQVSTTPASTTTPGSTKAKCFQCIGCAKEGYSMPEGELKECPAGQEHCTKADAEIFGFKVTSRGCAKDCNEGEIFGTRIYCCKGEKCNSASTLTLSLPIAMVTVAVAYYLH
jgi:hypothetical protein